MVIVPFFVHLEKMQKSPNYIGISFTVLYVGVKVMEREKEALDILFVRLSACKKY